MGEVLSGRYELLEPVAEGGMGSVWVVRDHDDGAVKAAKVLRQSDASSLIRFVREQSVRIAHPHVLAPLSWAGADDRVLFTMPLVRGGSVAGLLGDFHRLPPRWTVTLLDQVLQALEAVHRSGVVHRDIKPANLLLEPTGARRPHVLLGDFGIAAQVDSPRLTRASQVFGSPGYMSPEQARGADPGPGQDLYALGMVGLEMVSGERPPASPEAARQVALDDPGQAGLVEVLLGAVATEPTARPQSAAELRRQLGELTLTSGGREDEPFVFDHFEEYAAPATPAPAPASAPSPKWDAAPEPSAVPEPAPDLAAEPEPERSAPARSSRSRMVAFALIAVSAVCALTAILIVASL